MSALRITHRHRRLSDSGIFLVELLVSLAVVAVFAGLALPGLQQLIRAHRVRTVAQDLLADMAWARAEAVRRGIQVTLHLPPEADCPDPKSCQWQIYLDGDEKGPVYTGQPMLRRYVVPSGVELRDAEPQAVTFHAQDSVSLKTFRVKVVPSGAEETDTANRVLCMGFGARLRMASGTVCKA